MILKCTFENDTFSINPSGESNINFNLQFAAKIGLDGQSAYQYAVAHGYTGTEAAFAVDQANMAGNSSRLSAAETKIIALETNMPKISAQVATHNSNTNAHTDIRGEIAQMRTDMPSITGLATDTSVDSKDTATLNAAKQHATTADTQTLSAAKDFTTAQINKIPTPDVSGQIATHNTAPTAHNDIRTKITALETSDTAIREKVGQLETATVQTIETITGTAATLNVLGGHTYLCENLTSLTLSTIENSPREAVIRFTSGATATTLTLPVTLKIVGYVKPAANKAYEISIRSGAAVIVNF